MRTRKESMESKNCREPRLRLPGFEGEWVEKTLGESFDERSEKNRSDLPLLSLGENGLVYQSETARKDNSSADKSKYLRVAVGDIAYNTMRMWQGRCVHADIEGIVSPAYTVCKPREGVDSLFHYYLFRTQRMIQLFHQNSQGLVSDTLNLKYDSFSKIKYLIPPSLAEQEKIAHCLSEADNMITAQEHKVESLKAHKKGLMQQLFPHPGTTTPSLRFPGFTGEWQERPLSHFLYEHKTKSDGKCEVHSVSVNKGVINQVEYLGRSFAASDTSKYNLAKPGDIIYTKSPTGAFPYGIVKQNKNPYNVIVSPLYAVYTPVNKYVGYILDSYFESSVNTNNYLSSLIQKGAKNTIQISNDTFVSKSMCLPIIPDEQQKIAECLESLDMLIASEIKELESLKIHKDGLMQQLFPQPVK